jgi:hypothetical protein
MSASVPSPNPVLFPEKSGISPSNCEYPQSFSQPENPVPVADIFSKLVPAVSFHSLIHSV